MDRAYANCVYTEPNVTTASNAAALNPASHGNVYVHQAYAEQERS